MSNADWRIWSFIAGALAAVIIIIVISDRAAQKDKKKKDQEANKGDGECPPGKVPGQIDGTCVSKKYSVIA